MAYMEWSEDLSLGITIIDNQHKTLIDMINAFHEELKQDKTEAISKLLDALLSYTEYHFKTEANFFEKCAYKEAKIHQKKHAEFIEKICKIKSRLKAGRMVLTTEVTGFLKGWLLVHIKGEDKRYVECLQSHGIV